MARFQKLNTPNKTAFAAVLGGDDAQSEVFVRRSEGRGSCFLVFCGGDARDGVHGFQNLFK